MEDYIPGGNTFMQRKKLEGREKTAVMAAEPAEAAAPPVEEEVPAENVPETVAAKA